MEWPNSNPHPPVQGWKGVLLWLLGSVFNASGREFQVPRSPVSPHLNSPVRRPSANDQIDTLLTQVYSQGAFPMADDREGEVNFFVADPRSVLPLDDDALTISRSLRHELRAGRFVITTDLAFQRVIAKCADAPRPRDGGTWINDWIIHAYSHMHSIGKAHSIEAWLVPPGVTTPNPATHTLVGGLYGLHLGAAFFGESMFTDSAAGGTSASKICLVYLWHLLRRQQFRLLDTQVANDHMRQFGIQEIPLDLFRPQLQQAMNAKANWPKPGVLPVVVV
jgi:leucyl/phenylalanyl-tRNA---protein transferase